MTALSLEEETPVLATGVVTMPCLSGARSTARRLASGGPIDAALIDCSMMEGSSRSMAQELIVQLVDVRGARWIQLIEPTPFWADHVRAQMQRRGTAGSLSVIPRASSAN